MKNIIITGASKGLGLTIVKELLTSEEYAIYSINRSFSDELKSLAEINKNRLFLYQYDLIDIKNIKEKIFKEFITFKIPIHGFVNNAAIAYDDIVTNLNYDLLLNMFKVNVFSPMMIVKYVIRNMLFNCVKGSIIHISSISVHTGYKGLSMYAATKGALEAFSKNIAREWGTRGIRSNAIVAGFMETSMNSKLSDELKDRIYSRTSLKEPTRKENVASLVKFLLSDDAYSITGQNIFVDSGTI